MFLPCMRVMRQVINLLYYSFLFQSSELLTSLTYAGHANDLVGAHSIHFAPTIFECPRS
jgi:hypothetical protein